MLEYCRLALERVGYAVLQASRGVEALSVYRQQNGQIDLVLDVAPSKKPSVKLPSDDLPKGEPRLTRPKRLSFARFAANRFTESGSCTGFAGRSGARTRTDVTRPW